ncbi:hypothetical protein Rpal_3904 [Rhodopseudomonas palustris TIE-1]|uniref:hypothetical protein n=1 Tax=Rhodopseudomonas palustris TaxID=1076 RepID=UPI0001779802|nr:hypothetical protein [Rhodopseudomonas palustris]ACF02402.1 hypothetical protein Rpal_3904 [Rhodopseudomonas palustris TIE-1]
MKPVLLLVFIASLLLKALPRLIGLVSRYKASADADVAHEQGHGQAVADGLKLMGVQLFAAVTEARERQAAHPGSDDGLDTEFRRD